MVIPSLSKKPVVSKKAWRGLLLVKNRRKRKAAPPPHIPSLPSPPSPPLFISRN